MDPLIRRIHQAFPLEGRRVVRLAEERPIVCVGDVHGDEEAVRLVLRQFPPPEHTLVFLGDLLDRGPDSRAVLEEVVDAKIRNPSSVHLLMGNHEAWTTVPFHPAGFWESLPGEVAGVLGEALLNLPYMARHSSGLAAVHGALPDLTDWAEIERVEPGSPPWFDMVWGDWVEDAQRVDSAGGRPALNPTAFFRRSAQLGIRVLVRSHQLSAPLTLFDQRCLTVFTSCAVDAVRQVVRWIPGRTVSTASDLDWIEL